jgi:predicted metalloprotease with PDZ domain
MNKFLVTLLVFSASILANAQDISYQLSMSEPHTHYFEVEMTVAGLEQEYIDFNLPVWAPGSYLVREFSKSVENFESGDLKFELLNKNTWRVYTNKAKEVTINYKIYANEMSVRTSFLDIDHAYINGTSVFMFVEELKDKPITLTITPYSKWGKTTTALEKSGDNKFTALNYDILVDSPIEIGNHLVFEFNAAGVKHTVAMFGDGNFNIDSLKKDMAIIVESCTDVIGENPNKEYTFIIHNLSKSSGGLEHLNSTTLQVERWSYHPTKKYLGFLSLVAHEYFHLWNVKRIRPENLGPFDYNHECYTDLLWVSEGFTSYYDELLLQRTGYYNTKKYLEVLSGTISKVENQPGNRVQPVSEASFNAWIKAYRRNENSYNTTISYYPKGSLIALALDLEIINATKGENNLDNLMQLMYKRYYKELDKGFTEADIKKEIETIVGYSMDDFFANYVNNTVTIDYNKFFNYVGFDLVDDNKSTDRKARLGIIKSTSEKGKLKIGKVIRGTSAYESGLNANDEIISINGFRVDLANFTKTLSQYQVGETVEFIVARDGILKTIKVLLKEDNTLKYKLVKQEKLTKEQAINLKKWLREN